ncbi:MAG TPA: 2-phospho-L-lactate transferase, partial [Thermomicrobiales bacterium]|nr:2-phospho-L-lactate transferase [Thermomicrobiales bacterium]
SVVALAGGVGGAKLAQGLAGAVDPERLSIIVNTADDFRLWGLHISPDLDTVMYTLAGIANPVTGWGIAGDSFAALDMLGRLGEDAWFRVGDQDFATHIRRTSALQAGRSLTDITAGMSTALGIEPSILPMTDSPVSTMVEPPAGTLAFQDYFVARRQQDDVLGVTFEGIDGAALTDDVTAALSQARIIVICPSNPIVSIGPILALPGVRARLAASPAVRVAVSPIVAGKALKGPADRMLTTLGHDSSATGVAALYRDLVDLFVIDSQDAAERPAIEALGMRVHVTDTIMGGLDDRERLAREVLDVTAGVEAVRP